MRIFTPTEIQQEKNKERKIEIDQGMLLAKKIDTLRETYAIEQNHLETFRSQNIKRVTQEIDELVIKRQNLQREFDELEEHRKELLIPLTDQWNQVMVASHDVEQKEKNVAEESKRLIAIERDLNQKIYQVSIDRETTSNILESTKKENESAIRIREKASEKLVSITERENEFNKKLLSETTRLEEWERRLTYKERDIANKVGNKNIADKTKTIKTINENRRKR